MHEDKGSLACFLGLLQLGSHPVELCVIQPEVWPAGACGDDVQEQAAMPADRNGVWQTIGPKDLVERRETARVKVVIARQNVQRD